ncbi:MAG TPA: N-acetyltransferase, partial [Pseudonocardiaceae bacterium]|nr:N-acetyltransferase [Pseudonocardiaceae bacterium]
MAELADLLREVADGALPDVGSDLLVIPPPDPRSVGVLAFTGCSVVSVDAPDTWVRHRLPTGDPAAPLASSFLGLLAAATGREPENLDVVLVARGNGRASGLDLTPLSEADDHPRVRRAEAHRTGVVAWRCAGGLLVLGRGVAGRWEVAVEVDPVFQGFGLGRGLFGAALGLVPAGEPVWAQIAPGNAQSMRAALGAGFQPVGAEVLLAP